MFNKQPMSATATFTRKSISLDADLAARLDGEAKQEGRSLSNLINFRLRALMAKGATKPLRRRKGVKA